MDRPVIFDWRQQLLVLARSPLEQWPDLLEPMRARWRTALWQEGVRCFGGGVIHCEPRRRRYFEREVEQWLIAGGFHPEVGPLKAMGVPPDLIPLVIGALARTTPWTRTRSDMQRLRGLREVLEPLQRRGGEQAPFYAAALEELRTVERELSTSGGTRRRGGHLSPLAHHRDVVTEIYRLLDDGLPKSRGHRRRVLDMTRQVVEWALGGLMFTEWPQARVDPRPWRGGRPGAGRHRVGSLRADEAQPADDCDCQLVRWLPPAPDGTPERLRPKAQVLPPTSCPEGRERLRQVLKNRAAPGPTPLRPHRKRG